MEKAAKRDKCLGTSVLVIKTLSNMGDTRLNGLIVAIGNYWFIRDNTCYSSQMSCKRRKDSNEYVRDQLEQWPGTKS